MTFSGFQKLTLLDFPGKTASIVFTRDCNFRCPFCHNASLVLCRGCEVIAEDDVLSYLDRRKKLLDGLSITGGEPLMQEGLCEFIRKVKALGYAVKLDTNGTYPERLKALLDEGLLDYVAMDLKNSEREYLKTAGISNASLVMRVKESIRLIMASGVDYEFRTTLVKGLHTEDSLREALSLITGAERYYLQRFTDSGDLIAPEGLSAFSYEEMRAFLKIAQEVIPTAALRGVDA